MRKLAFLPVAFSLVAVGFYGCDKTHLTEPAAESNAETVAAAGEAVPSEAALFSSERGQAVLPFWATGGNANTNPSTQFLGTLDNQSLAFRTNGAEAMRVTPTRRIGIGTTNPAALLHLRSEGGTLHELLVQETSPGAASIIRVQNAVRNWKLVSDASPDVFQIESEPGSVPRLAILGSNGNVGIGTNNPQATLHVSGGDIRVTGGSFIDDGTTLNVPDYVFEEPYTLMSMAELRAFIRQEGHLPNVPSADDVRRDGLNLSQFQMKLLEKVEELTLYALTQDEQIHALRTQVEELQDRLAAEVR